MNVDYLQLLKDRLRQRSDRLIHWAGRPHFHAALIRFWHFLSSNEMYRDILRDLTARANVAEGEVVNFERLDFNEVMHVMERKTEQDYCALCAHMIQYCAVTKRMQPLIEQEVGHQLFPPTQQAGVPENTRIENFRQKFVVPLVDYIDEELLGARAVQGILLRYKHKCECFCREDLLKRWKARKREGEWVLKLNLFEYLHDNCFDFQIEPWRVSGQVDLIGAQQTADPLIAEAKVFSDDSSKADIRNGFNQAFQYTQHFNEPIGYLVIFKTNQRDIRIDSDIQYTLFPAIAYSNKVIFVVTIDISPRLSPSESGPANPFVIGRAELTGGPP